MPKEIPDCPKKPNPAPDAARCYEIELITPMFGGGVEPRINDPNFPIRPTTVRGQLQFWWRATVGAQYATLKDLRTEQSSIWGSTGRASRVQVRVENVKVSAPVRCARYEKQGDRFQSTPSWNTPFSGQKNALTVANELQTAGRLIVGFGSENVLETGIRMHHTYGLPIIPGSALKGLAGHYCDQVWGAGDKQFKRPTLDKDNAYRQFLAGKGPKPDDNFHQLLFGSTDDSGCITFHDAWYAPSSSNPFMLDVMTPHHPQWNVVSNPAAPTDFDSPIPVPFLSVTGAFHVAVSWRGPASDKARNWTELTLSLLCDALRDWGIGGKTTSGYGRLALPPPLPPPKRRHSNDKARVKITAVRPKGGFDVQDVEPGRAPGTLTVGAPSPGADTNTGAVVDVLVHIDEPKRPQYKWPQSMKK